MSELKPYTLATPGLCFKDFKFNDDGEDALYIEFPDHRKVKYVPERTCELEPLKGGYRRCKRCGAFVRADAVTDCCSIIPIRFCPNCGASVVK